MADSSRPQPSADTPGSDSGTWSPQGGRRRAQQAGGLRSRYRSSAPGHWFRKTTLTKPTFCHSCSDFIWGLAGFLCEVCNLMCHEKCLKSLRSVCSSVAPSLVQVPVAHCLSPAGQKRRVCCVCRKQTEGNNALRCEVCELHVHADCAVFSVADCRCSHLDGSLEEGVFHHHWREGNLPPGSRCAVCRRSCGSADFLCGIRCEWCGVTCHSSCSLSVPAVCVCDARLASMLLPPSCVRLDSRNFSKMHCYRMTESPAPLLDNSDDVDSSAVASKDLQPAAADSGKQFLKVFDGDDAVKRGFCRLVSVCRANSQQEVVEACLWAFYLPYDPEDYELQEVGGAQRLHSLDLANRNGGGLKEGGAWILRAKPRKEHLLQVFAGWGSSGSDFIPVPVSESTTASAVLTEVLSQLNRQDEDESSFSLVEVNMSSKQVQRQTLTPQEKILDKLQEIGKVSLRQLNQTRFYLLQQKQGVVQVELLLGGLPPLLVREEYDALVNQHLHIKNHLVSVSHVYGSQGALVLQVSCFSEAERIFMLAKDTSVNNKNLHSLVVPHILPQSLCPDVCPLLVFVNPKSGGLKGRDLLYGFRKLLNPHQVFDICNGGPLAGLHTFRSVPRFRVLVCGGDGTVGWVLSVLEAVRHKLTCREPPIAILPLGTGNDLARILRWGPGFSGEDLQNVLVSVDQAEQVLMDRWTILLDAQDLSHNQNQDQDQNQDSTQDGTQDQNFLEPPKIVQMNNYFGLGIDAELSLDFHLAREGEPDKFTSRFHNKGVYVKVGLQKISSSRSLYKEITLQVDTHTVPLPHIEGLIFLNIPSWGSGADLWGSEVDGRFGKPRIDDGLLEVVGVTGVVHMGQVQGGLRSGIRIAQGNYIRLTVSKAIPVQVDGEPWIQPPGHIIISAAGPKVRMLRKSKQKQKKTSGGGLRDARSESPSSRDGGP